MEYFGRIDISETGWESHSNEYYYRLPNDVQWYSARCPIEEVAGFYHRCGKYSALSGGTGRISESARRITLGQTCEDSTEQADRIRQLVSEFSSSEFRPLALGTNDLESGPFNILEGNCRGVALEILRERGLAPFPTVRLFIAMSESQQVRVWE